MNHIFDFHFHSLYSDGKLMPEDLVAAAQKANPEVTHLALSDHDTFNGCARFLESCKAAGIKGFAASEIGGTHPDFPEFEIHLIANFGTEWNEGIEKRTDLFHPYWNSLRKNDLNNLFLFLECAAKLGYPLSYRDVTRKSLEEVLKHPDLKDPGLIQPMKFGFVRDLMKEKGIELKTRKDEDSMEKKVWRRTGVRPAFTPPYTGAYEAFQKAKPAVIMAHPMIYPWTMEQAEQVLSEFKTEVGLIGLEAHYGGQFYPEWKHLADKLDLLVSAGSDCHSTWGEGGIPVVHDDQCNFERLLEVLKAAGE